MKATIVTELAEALFNTEQPSRPGRKPNPYGGTRGAPVLYLRQDTTTEACLAILARYFKTRAGVATAKAALLWAARRVSSQTAINAEEAAAKRRRVKG